MAEETLKKEEENQKDVSSDTTTEEKKEEDKGEEVTLEQLKKDLEEERRIREEEKRGLVEQIKALRRRAQEAEAKLLAYTKEKIEESGREDETKDEIEKKVLNLIRKEKEEARQRNRAKALHLFWEKYPEFSPENDISGIKMDRLNSYLARLNVSESVEVEDILKDYEDALRLMGYKKQESKEDKGEEILNKQASAPTGSGSPKSSTEPRLSAKEEALIKESGITPERYLELKRKYPHIFGS